MAEEKPVTISTAEVTRRHGTVTLSDGRVVSTPLDWYPLLAAASDEKLQEYSLSPFGLHWDNLDEDLGLAGMLAGQGSSDMPDAAFEDTTSRA